MKTRQARGVFGRLRPSPRNDSGAAAVEAALILPVFFILLFGIIDFALVLKDSNAVSNSVRAAGRSMSAVPKQVMTVNEPRFNTAIADGVNVAVITGMKAALSNLTGVKPESIQEIWFYQTAANGVPSNSTSLPSGGSAGTCIQTCVKYTYDPSLAWVDTTVNPSVNMTGGFKRVSGSWPAASINACQGNSSSLAVYLKIRRSFLFPWTSWVAQSPTIDVKDTAGFRFEPLGAVSGTNCTNTSAY